MIFVETDFFLFKYFAKRQQLFELSQKIKLTTVNEINLTFLNHNLMATLVLKPQNMSAKSLILKILFAIKFMRSKKLKPDKMAVLMQFSLLKNQNMTKILLIYLCD